ncbi:hypothetical protein [Chthonobacter rhizosphaerae]|uniref:hypothetical protein n=1 Tax=Chthonobacter rhizosphaerae TaxID=2735553 RepID=UPI0015EEDEA5|nr:hypothetical protein [Chthonobacter rhizosphaerae]
MISIAVTIILTVAYGLVASVFFASTTAELIGRGRTVPAAVLIALPTALLWPVTLLAAILFGGGAERRPMARRLTTSPPGLSPRA